MRGLIGLDWGTSSLRAYRLDAAGRVEETRTRPWGIRQLPNGGFDAALAEITEGWQASLPRLACGMVGSRDGWHEMPYVDLPADAKRIAASMGQLRTGSGDALYLAPGLRDPHGPDLMRGEETQLLGALSLQPELADQSIWILPGTHSKWVSVCGGGIAGFRTFMTGELFGVLQEHSILGQKDTTRRDEGSFARGVETARDSGNAGALSRLFSARALMLEGALQPGSVSDYLSGLLVGEEFRVALADQLAEPGATLHPIGEPELCERYHCAAAQFGIDLVPPLQHAAAQGLWALAVQAGLIHPSAKATQAC